MKSINCNGKLIDFDTPKVMGILNLTPDSFYDGGRYQSKKEVLLQVEKMLSEGATFVDIGAYSSRPGAEYISENEELSRLLPILKDIINFFPDILVSVDTFRSKVAKESIATGASMINDISAGRMDEKMFRTIAKLQVPYIIMHMRGDSQTMQQLTNYDDLIKEIILYFSKKVYELRQLGVNDIILDPGFGFSKSIDQNYQLLDQLDMFKFMDLPIVTGLSRKSMLYKFLDISPEEALNATTVAHTIALQNGINIIRAHDVKEAMEAVKIVSLTHGQAT